MKKKWIIPAIIAVVLVAIALFIAAYPNPALCRCNG